MWPILIELVQMKSQFIQDIKFHLQIYDFIKFYIHFKIMMTIRFAKHVSVCAKFNLNF